MKRKQLIKSAGKAIVLVALATSATLFTSGCKCPCNYGGKVEVANENFYKDGVFQADKAKEAYFELMARFNYPVYPVLKTDEFWVCDFKQSKFTDLGMGGIFWINREGIYGETGQKKYDGKFKGQKFGYLGHEIFCLPGQALPEHRHVGGAKGYGPKMESWHVRYGEVCFFSELDPGGDRILISEMPKEEQPWGYGEPWFKSKYVDKVKAGGVYSLKDPESYHFMRAGKDGAIISEYATFHNQVEFSKPGMIFANTGSK